MSGTWRMLAAALMAGTAMSVSGPARADTPLASGTVISGAGNGVGNRISVSGASGTTVIRGSRWGVGNSIRVENGGSSVVVDDDGVTIDGEAVTRTPQAFWSKRVWSEKCNAYLYWSPRAKGWYRYHTADRAYYPLEVYPEE